MDGRLAFRATPDINWRTILDSGKTGRWQRTRVAAAAGLAPASVICWAWAGIHLNWVQSSRLPSVHKTSLTRNRRTAIQRGYLAQVERATLVLERAKETSLSGAKVAARMGGTRGNPSNASRHLRCCRDFERNNSRNAAGLRAERVCERSRCRLRLRSSAMIRCSDCRKR